MEVLLYNGVENFERNRIKVGVNFCLTFFFGGIYFLCHSSCYPLINFTNYSRFAYLFPPVTLFIILT